MIINSFVKGREKGRIKEMKLIKEYKSETEKSRGERERENETLESEIK